MTASGQVKCFGHNLAFTVGYGGPADESAAAGCVADAAAETVRDCDLAADCCYGDDESADDVPFLDVGEPVAKISVSTDPFGRDAVRAHVCVLTDRGSVRCWGEGGSGQLGVPGVERLSDPTAATDVELGEQATDVTTGVGFSCALTDSGSVYCWGQNDKGQLGYGHTNVIGDDETPAEAGPVPL